MLKTVWLFDVVFTGRSIVLKVGAYCLFLKVLVYKHTADIKGGGPNGENSDSGGCFFYDCSNIEGTFKFMDRNA